MAKVTKILPNTEFMLHDTIFTYSIKDGAIELKRLRKGKIKESNPPPTLEEVSLFCKEKGYNIECATKAWEYYEAMGWKDNNNKPVKSWKGKLIAVWFRSEFKIKESDNNSPYSGMVF